MENLKMCFAAHRPPILNAPMPQRVEDVTRTLLAEQLLAGCHNPPLSPIDRNIIARALRAATAPTDRRDPSEFEKGWAWNVCAEIPGCDRDGWRRDVDGRPIKRDEYGQKTAFGWEVDHIIPLSEGGAIHVLNMRARHYIGNRSAGGLLSGK